MWSQKPNYKKLDISCQYDGKKNTTCLSTPKVEGEKGKQELVCPAKPFSRCFFRRLSSLVLCFTLKTALGNSVEIKDVKAFYLGKEYFFPDYFEVNLPLNLS